MFYNGSYQEVYLLRGRKIELYENGTLKLGYLERNQVFQDGRKRNVYCLACTKIMFYPSGYVQYANWNLTINFTIEKKELFYTIKTM